MFQRVISKAVRQFVISIVVVTAVTVAAGQDGAPLQAETVVRVSNTRRAPPVSFSAELRGGEAILAGSATNQPGGDTVLVALRFDYTTPAEIALDEIISKSSSQSKTSPAMLSGGCG